MKELVTGLFASGIATLTPEAAIFFAAGWLLHLAWRSLQGKIPKRKRDSNEVSAGDMSQDQHLENALEKATLSINEDVEPRVVEQGTIESLLVWVDGVRGQMLRPDEVNKAVVSPLIEHMRRRMRELQDSGMGCNGSVIWKGIRENGEKWLVDAFNYDSLPRGIPVESCGLEVIINMYFEMQGIGRRKALVSLEGVFENTGKDIKGKWQLGWDYKRSDTLNEARAGAYNLEKAMVMIDEAIREEIGGWKGSDEST